jgi:hypothetical protein
VPTADVSLFSAAAPAAADGPAVSTFVSRIFDDWTLFVDIVERLSASRFQI